MKRDIINNSSLRYKKNKMFYTIMISMIVNFIICSYSYAGSEIKNSMNGFNIHILDYTWFHLGNDYNFSEIWPKIKKLNLHKTILTLDINDIDSYQWDKQSLILNANGAKKINSLKETEWIEFTQHENSVFECLTKNFVFLVTLNEKKLYGGLLYNEQGAAAIKFPVIHIYKENKVISFYIRSGLIYNKNSDNYIKMKKIQHYFKKLGKIKK